ncbi:MAG: hypothetical protein M0P14_08115 [Alkaliphilus sp.]|nr:hypothetical protein [Alkaliphilus sp.]
MKNKVFSKEKFVKIMTKYEKYDNIYDNLNEAAKGLEFFKFYHSEFADLVIDTLIEAFKDKDYWIAYFIFELEFGKKWTKGSINDNGKIVVLQTAEDLYDLLVGEPKYLG